MRNLDGVCTNSLDPAWGTARQSIPATPLPTGHASPLSSRLFTDARERDEAVTEWLGAWTAFFKSDMLDIRLEDQSKKLYRNYF